MSRDRLIPGWINPLAFLEVDLPWAQFTQDGVSTESILRFLCPADEAVDPTMLVARYKAISTEPVPLSIAPADQRILDKLVWPLRHAKASYMVGNYLATVALCGMVGEMVAILYWEISNVQLNGHRMSKAEEKAIFGAEVERLGQERRVKALLAYSAITEETKTQFDVIREKRRGYLHLWSEDHDTLPQDAITCFHAAVSLVVGVIGQEVRDGKLVLNPRLSEYLERKGLYQGADSALESGDGQSIDHAGLG